MSKRHEKICHWKYQDSRTPPSTNNQLPLDLVLPASRQESDPGFLHCTTSHTITWPQPQTAGSLCTMKSLPAGLMYQTATAVNLNYIKRPHVVHTRDTPRSYNSSNLRGMYLLTHQDNYYIRPLIQYQEIQWTYLIHRNRNR